MSMKTIIRKKKKKTFTAHSFIKKTQTNQTLNTFSVKKFDFPGKKKKAHMKRSYIQNT